MRSWFTFKKDRGICILDNSFSQLVDIPTHRPSIAGPDGSTVKLLEALRAGGHYISLEDTSDLPFIGIMDKDLLTNEANPSANSDLLENLVVVGQEGVYFDKPIAHPLVFPPLARWFLGHNEAVDLIDIGGQVGAATWVTPQDDAFLFRVVIKAHKEKSTVKTSNPNMLRLKIKNLLPVAQGIQCNAVGIQGERWFNLPTFIVGKRDKTVAGKGETINEDPMLFPITWYIKAFHNETELGMITRPVNGTVVLESNPQTIIGMDLQDVSKGNKISCGVHFEGENPGLNTTAKSGSFFEIGSDCGGPCSCGAGGVIAGP